MTWGGGGRAGTRRAAAGDDYRLVLRGEGKNAEEEPRPDPVSRFQPDGVHGPSRVVDLGAFEWKHSDGWRGREMEIGRAPSSTKQLTTIGNVDIATIARGQRRLQERTKREAH